MKRIIKVSLGIALITSVLQLHSQESYEEAADKNEIKLNLVYGVLEIVELHYERIVNDDIGLGFSGSYHFGEFSDVDALLLPYLRFYPSNSRRAEGFFIEANTGVVLTTNEEDFFLLPNGDPIIEESTEANFGFGVAAGGKFISKSGFFGEVYAGVGRVFGDNTFIETYPRIGLNLGYRF